MLPFKQIRGTITKVRVIILKTVSPCNGYIERTQGKTGGTGKDGLSGGTNRIDVRQKEASFFKAMAIFLTTMFRWT